MALITYIGLYYLLDCDYLLQYEVGITVFYYLFHMESHMPFASAIPIGAFRWISQAILTKMGNIINLRYVEIITCKNVLLLLLHKLFKRSIYSLSVALFLCDVNFYWKAVKSQSVFQKKDA